MMKKSILLGGVVFTFFAYFASFVGSIHAGDATITLDDNAGSSSFVVQDSDKTNQFKVNSDGQGYFAGNVGIGTTGPTGLLTVYSSDSSGKFRIGQNSSSDYSIWRDSATGFLQFNGSQAGFIGYVFNNGNLGIGTTAPGYKLDVQSSGSYDQFRVRATGSSGTGGEPIIKLSGLYNSGNGAEIWQDVNGKLAFNINSNLTGMVIIPTGNQVGNVGIGTTAPTERLDVAGNIKASGTVSQGSSKEFKKNISYISTKDAMKTLDGLNPVRFEYKADDTGEKHLGFIAEDVPDLVAEHDRKHLNSMDITAVLTKVVQEQQRVIQEQQKRIENLEKSIGL